MKKGVTTASKKTIKLFPLPHPICMFAEERQQKKPEEKALQPRPKKERPNFTPKNHPTNPSLFMRALPWAQVEQMHHRTHDAAHRKPYWVVAS
jgi:hypothetical protein